MSDEKPHPGHERAPENADDARHGVPDGITAAWQQRFHNLVEHSLGLICTHDLTGVSAVY